MEKHKIKNQIIKSLAKEMMKRGNLSEYYKLLNELIVVKRHLIKS